jgi:hypothetical protein
MKHLIIQYSLYPGEALRLKINSQNSKFSLFHFQNYCKNIYCRIFGIAKNQLNKISVGFFLPVKH